uniref:Pentatricopeptide repeat-containing protein At2g01860 n=1 Tax=Rhizophora mucronata TaxID=61149 RepID=A0A2P2L6C8_RHIMU
MRMLMEQTPFFTSLGADPVAGWGLCLCHRCIGSVRTQLGRPRLSSKYPFVFCSD